MSAETFKILNLQEKDLDRSNVPQVVGAEGTSLGAIGRIECELKIGKETCKQKFLVCQNLRRHLILGVDFAKTYAAGVHWTKHNSFVLTIDGVKVAETTEKHQLPSVSLKSRVKIPPRHCAIIDVDINTDSKDKIRITGDDYCLNQNPNMYIDPISADLSQRTDESVCPLAVVNLSSDQYIEMPKNHVLAFAKKDEVEVESCFDIEEDPDPSPRNWIPRQPRRPAGTIAEMMSGIPRTFTGLQKLFTGDERQSVQPVAEVDVVKTETDLHQILTSASNFIKSPAEVETHRKVDLDDAATSEETKVKFTKLCDDFQDIVSQGSTDIGKTLLVEMDIETGDSPPIASRPYTLPLKHYDWVRKEITQLERADIITKSISPWASPVVIVPKKTIPGAPPERRMCVDFRRLNGQLPKVQNTSGGKGCISLVPLPKIDELYAKLKGHKYFSTLDLRSGYYHIGLSESAKPKTAFVVSGMGKYQFNRVPFGLAQAPAYFQRLINEVLTDIDFAMGYLDDIIIFSETEEEHLRHLEIIFERLRKAKLKLKLQKCNFFKRHIQYLGHLISSEGIHPLPEKLESIKNMPTPNSPKQVKQFLGLVGYYRKFVPRFADISRPLTKLTKKNEVFTWTPECDRCFKMLKDSLQEAPILRYPDPNAEYTLYTDASNYAYAGVLTQKDGDTDHPVAYTSGLFRGSQCNWAALTKEAYAIYMSVKKLSFYLDSANITLRSDHKPLQKFLEKNTMNAKVNNWAVELESYNIKFCFIEGQKNVLADTLSRLIEINNDVKQPAEKPGYEFGYTPFEELPAAQVEVVEEVIIAEDCGSEEVLLLHERPVKMEPPVKVPIPDHKMMELQEQDEYVSRLRTEWQLGRLDANYFKMERDVLRKRITINGVPYEPVILPGILQEYVLMLAHNEQGHNGSRRTYNALRYVYYWKGMKNAVERHCKRCYTCAKFNIRVHKLKKQHFKVPAQPMEFISMDLIGEFHPPSSKGNRYALTAICMLTGFTFCIPLKSKTAKDVVTAYMDNIYCVFGPSRRILTDNGTEFRNKFWEQVFKDTRMSHLTSPIYSPQCNGRIEGFHKFLKATIGKQLHRGLEWDDVIPQATSAYNFFPTESSKESPFFLMFGRQPAVKHMLLDSESTKYLGDDEGKLKIEVMRKLYHIIAYNLAKSRAARDGNKRDEENKPEEEQFEPGTNVLVRDHTKKVFHAEYTDHTVVEQVGKNQFVVKDNHGQEKKVHRSDMKEIDSDVKIAELYKQLRDEGMRDEKHCMPIKQIPDLGWKALEAAKATPAGDPDDQSLRSPPPATTETPPAGDSDNQSVRTKTPKFPQLEPMPQRKTPLRRSERIKKKMDTINEIVNEKEKVAESTPQGNETLNIFKLAVTTSFAAACAIAVKTLEMQVFQA